MRHFPGGVPSAGGQTDRRSVSWSPWAFLAGQALSPRERPHAAGRDSARRAPVVLPVVAETWSRGPRDPVLGGSPLEPAVLSPLLPGETNETSTSLPLYEQPSSEATPGIPGSVLREEKGG